MFSHTEYPSQNCASKGSISSISKVQGEKGFYRKWRKYVMFAKQLVSKRIEDHIQRIRKEKILSR